MTLFGCAGSSDVVACTIITGCSEQPCRRERGVLFGTLSLDDEAASVPKPLRKTRSPVLRLPQGAKSSSVTPVGTSADGAS